ncbi:MAG TPA: phenylalanine--tRNA ligase subunit beta [Candidatus Bathyarchaeia archaeon]|nr:phenylalanine--tRNA ligase subunit beta [Candidatus Bathyarchaeia archaeon]
MNIQILDSWLREFLKTTAKPTDIARCLSLCGPSVERITKKDGDYLYDIEITSNRPDCLSVTGLAREAAAILPNFGFKADFMPSKILTPQIISRNLPLQVKSSPQLCRRVICVVLDDIEVKTSPLFIRRRLESAGVRSLINIIDITNYVMLETGHPTHAFDYDRIKTHKLIIRPSIKGEKFTTLDNKTFALPGDDSIIEDGTGLIIDLPGIIGSQNSVVTPQTKRLLFFIENNDPYHIRKTAMTLGIRTMAASFNEKGPDPELSKTALLRGIELYQKYAHTRVCDKIIDIYPKPYIKKTIKTNIQFINNRMGIELKSAQIKKILDSLGLETSIMYNSVSSVIPSWRADDINIPEDIVEEVARIYGYYNLPSIIPETKIPSRPRNMQFKIEEQIKDSLKYWGFTEIYNYSMISKELLEKSQLLPLENKHLKITNPISEEWIYMRKSLIPSLLSTVALNQKNLPDIKIFEMAKIYDRQSNNLPEERVWLTGIVGQSYGQESFRQAKGIVIAILENLGIKEYGFIKADSKNIAFWNPNRSASVSVKKQPVGVFGEIKPQIRQNFGIEIPFFVFDLNVDLLARYASFNKTYAPVSQYPPIIEDLSFVLPPNTPIGDLIQSIKAMSAIIQNVELVDIYQDTRTFRITYQSLRKTLTDKEIGHIRNIIIRKSKEVFKAEIKSLN